MELYPSQFIQENAAATTTRVRCAATTAMAIVRQPFQILTTTLLSLLLPLSFLLILQLCVGVGIEGIITTGVEGSSFGQESSFICRLVFFFGLHETMLFWWRAVVKPVVDDTIFGGSMAEGRLEKAVVGLSYGGLWWWRLREEVEALVVVAEVKREMMMGIGVVDFVGWWLYYVTVTVGMVRIVKVLISTVVIFTCRRESRPNDEKV